MYLRLFRHLAIVGLYAASWKYLSEWYLYRSTSDYLIFALLFFAAVLVSFAPWIGEFWSHSPVRVGIVLFVILLCLPWGEWFQFAPAIYTRKDWTEQILTQAVFLYVILTLSTAFRAIGPFVAGVGDRVVLALSSRGWIVYLPALLFFLLAGTFAVFVIRKTPLVEDTAAHLFQAKIFLRGKLYTPLPPVPEFLSFNRDGLVMYRDRWFEVYPPGLAALLAVAMLIKAEWFLCPLLGAASVWIWIAYARKWHSSRVAVLLGLLCLFSPFLVNMSATILMHTPELFIVSAVIYLCRSELEASSWKNRILLVVTLGVGFLIRAYSILAFLFPVLSYSVWHQVKKREIGTAAAIGIGILLGLGFLGLYQQLTAGSPWSSGYLVKTPDHHYGFGMGYGGQFHTPLRGLETVSNNLLNLHGYLSGWYLGSLFFVALFLLRMRLELWDGLLLISCLTLMLFYYFYFYQDALFGPRYYYVMAPFLLLLIARLLDFAIISKPSGLLGLVPSLIVVSIVAGLCTNWPVMMQQFQSSRYPQGRLREEFEKHKKEKILIFVYDQIRPDYVSWNDPFLQTAILVPDQGDHNAKAIAAFPEYKPAYYRIHADFNVRESKVTQSFFSEPDPVQSGYISLFELAMVLTGAADHASLDIFDFTYTSLFAFSGGKQELQYLQQSLDAKKLPEDYKSHLRQALIHTGILLLIPKAALAESGMDWQRALNPGQFRQQLQMAIGHFRQSAETGKSFIPELEKIERRIDRNKDGVLSDEEVRKYVTGKVHILQYALL